jgi:sugar lactone lactonase YvrE
MQKTTNAGSASADLRVIRDGLVFPECPRWRDGVLWFSDCHDGKVIALNPDGRVLESFEVPGGPAGLGWLPDGRLLAVSMADICIYRREADGRMARHADLSGLHRFHTNDMTVDAAGNAYVGEVGFRIGKEETRTTCIALARPDGTVEAAAEGVITPNGAAISPDGKTFIVAESWVRRVTAFDVASDGKLTKGRLFCQLGENDIPDGLCLDAEGCVWAAAPFSSSVIRISPTQGVVERLATDAAGRPYACVFGGADRRDLYICCAPDHDPKAVRAARAGKIAVARLDVAGAGVP